MPDHVAQQFVNRLNELADAFTGHARQAAEDIAPAVATVADTVTAEITARDERIRALEEQLDAAILFRVGDVRISRARGRWEVGISHTSPRWTPGTEPEELHDRDRAFARAHQLADDAHPTTERTTTR